MNTGVPPTLLNDRTGELTPPGMNCRALRNAASELEFDRVRSGMGGNEKAGDSKPVSAGGIVGASGRGGNGEGGGTVYGPRRPRLSNAQGAPVSAPPAGSGTFVWAKLRSASKSAAVTAGVKPATDCPNVLASRLKSAGPTVPS